MPYLCYAGVEVSNEVRVADYVNNVGVPHVTMSRECPCPALDFGYGGYDTPATDPAPWQEDTRPESNDFLGFRAEGIELPPVFSRNIKQRGGNGSAVSSLIAKGRVLGVSGSMWASSAEGMAYGERWLSEVLRGSPCVGGGCPADDLKILPACPELESYEDDRYFRTLVNVGVVDGPLFSPLQSPNHEHTIQQAAFTLVSTQPWLYHPPTRCLDAEILSPYYAGSLGCALTTPEWMGEGTFVIDITNIGTSNMEDITITGQISLSGSCPVSGTGTSVPYTFSYTIETLEPEDRIVIDGMRRQVRHYDASEKTAASGYSHITFTGPWKWPDVGPCTTMCLNIDTVAGEGEVTVDSVLREY